MPPKSIITLNINPEEEKITTKLQAEVEEFRVKAENLEGELNTIKQANSELENKIKLLKEQQKDLVDSKVALLIQTAQEIERMRKVMSDISQSNQSKAKTLA